MRGLDSWLAADPKGEDKSCEVCEERNGEGLFAGVWVCQACEETLQEEIREDNEK